MTDDADNDKDQDVYFYNTKLGQASSVGRPLNAGERKSILYFLANLQLNRKQQGEIPMSKREPKPQPAPPTKEEKQEGCNMAFIAGFIKSIKVDDQRAFVLVDTGITDKWVPCTLYEEEQLLEVIRHYDAGDFIKLVGFVRPWSQKKNEIWLNNVDVRITEIRSKTPAHRPPPKREAPQRKQAPLDPEDFDAF